MRIIGSPASPAVRRGRASPRGMTRPGVGPDRDGALARPVAAMQTGLGAISARLAKARPA